MIQCNRGHISSFYHGSAVDGEGLRCVIFFTGCNFRCPFCHNPETFSAAGAVYTVDEVAAKIMRYKNYIRNGGVTLSGGEPFLQAQFCIELVTRLKSEGINVIAETNGSIINRELIALLDGLRVDVKNFNRETAAQLNENYGEIIKYAKSFDKKLWLTNVLIPTVNDDELTLNELKKFMVEQGITDIELLPFKKLCTSKYAQLGLPFPYADIPAATNADVVKAYELLK